MEKILTALLRFDFAIVALLMKLSHAIDRNFGLNQFALAGHIVTFGLGCNVLANLMVFVGYGPLRDRLTYGGANLLSTLCLLLVYSPWIKHLERAARAYERDPSRMTVDMAFFMVPVVPPFRLFILAMGVAIMAFQLGVLSGSWALAFTVRKLVSPWMVLIALGLYIAGGIPPMGGRKEKKAKMPMGNAAKAVA